MERREQKLHHQCREVAEMACKSIEDGEGNPEKIVADAIYDVAWEVKQKGIGSIKAADMYEDLIIDMVTAFLNSGFISSTNGRLSELGKQNSDIAKMFNKCKKALEKGHVMRSEIHDEPEGEDLRDSE
jgi:hypothetical protein